MTTDHGREVGNRQGWTAVIVVVALTIVVFAAVMALARIAGVDTETLLDDVYQVAGSRWAALVSNVSAMLWTATVTLCLFGAWVASRPSIASPPWSRFLVASASIAMMLLIDDYFAIHELAGEIVRSFLTEAPSRVAQNLVELAVFGVYAAVIIGYVVANRDLLARTETRFLRLVLLLFAGSLILDLLPHGLFGLPESLRAMLEDGAKVIGIALVCAYFARTVAAITADPSGAMGD